MANDTSTGYSTNWNQSNLPGSRLLTFSPVQYPFLSRISARKIAKSTEFAMSVQVGLETDAQTAVTEAEAVTGATAIVYDPTNETNYIQIIQGAVNVSYLSESSQDRLEVVEVGSSGLGYTPSPLASGRGSLLASHMMWTQKQLYGTLEHSALNGTKTASTAASVAALMGGVIPSCTTSTVDGSSGTLTKAMIDELLLEMAGAGATFERPAIFCNAFQLVQLSKIFGYQPASFTDGGVAIDRLRTNFGTWEIVYSRRVPAASILFADMAQMAIVNQKVPGKTYMSDGLFMYEPKEKAGASTGGMIYGQLSIDFGSQLFHGSLTSLATS